MKKHLKVLMIFFMIFILALASLSGCGSTPQKPAPKKETENIPEVPNVLKEKEKTILSTMYTIDSIKGLEESLLDMEKESKEGQGNNNESGGDQKKNQKDKDGAKKKIDLQMLINENAAIIPVLKEEEIKDEIIKPESPRNYTEEVWYKIKENVSKLHRQWNVLETDLQNVKVSQTKAEEYEELMEKASKNIYDENIEESLMSLNELTLYLAEFRNYFKSKVPYEIYKLKYHTRRISLLANKEDFQTALIETKKSEEIAMGIRQQIIENKGESVIQKYELSLKDLEHEINTKNKELALIKSAIVMKNIELMIPLFENKP